MKFTLSKSVLLEALTVVGKCVGPNKIMPVLSNYLFDLGNGKLTISGSNMDMYLTTTVEVVSEGAKLSITVPGTQLLQLIKALPEMPVDFEYDGKSSIRITAGLGEYHIPVDRGDEFPIMKHESLAKFTISSKAILDGLEKTLFAAGTDELRPSLTGVLFRCEEGKITFTATNTHVLSTFSHPVESELVKDFILPAKVLAFLKGLPYDEHVEVSLDARNLEIRVNEDTIFRALLIDEKYPDYMAVLPQQSPIVFEVNRAEMLSSLKRLIQFSNKVTYAVKIDIRPDACKLTSQDVDFKMEAKEQLTGNLSGEQIEIGVRGTQVIDCLNRLSAEEVSLYFNGPNRPILIRENPPEVVERENLFLTMPIMLNNL